MQLCRAIPVLTLLLGSCSFLFSEGDAGVQRETEDADETIDAVPCAEPDCFCTVPQECGSRVCDPIAKMCVPEDRVIYLAQDGVDPDPVMATSCNRLSPCATFLAAKGVLASSSRDWVTFVDPDDNPATIAEFSFAQLNYSEATHPLILYGPGIQITTTSTDSLLEVSDGANVTVFGLHFHGNTTPLVRCRSETTLRLLDTEVSRASGHGIVANDCSLTIVRSKVHDNDGTGINVYDTTLTIVGSLISKNGRSNGDAGGIRIDQALNSPRDSHLYFNTIIGNTADASVGASTAGGVRCINLSYDGKRPIVAAGNLIQDNTAAHQVYDYSEGCVFNHSVVSGAATAKEGLGGGTLTDPVGLGAGENLVGASAAVDVSALDELLQITIPGLLGFALETDIDGTPRLVGEHPDMGAQEQPPP